MRDERSRRSPGFRSGMGLRLTDGQVWSVPVPCETSGHQDGPGASWDDPNYRAILRAVIEAEDRGELFRAELALAIHLLKWNYKVDGDELGDLLDDRDMGWARAGLASALHELASAHVGPAPGRDDVAPHLTSNPRKEPSFA